MLLISYQIPTLSKKTSQATLCNMNKGTEQFGSDGKISDLYLEGTRFQSRPGFLSWNKTVAGISHHIVALSCSDPQVTVPLWVLFNDAVPCYLRVAAVKNERMDERVWSFGEMILKGKDRSNQRKSSYSFILSITNSKNSVQDISTDSSQVICCPRRHLKWDNIF